MFTEGFRKALLPVTSLGHQARRVAFGDWSIMDEMVNKITWTQHLAIGIFVVLGTALAIYDFHLTGQAIKTLQASVPLVIEDQREPILPIPLTLVLDPAKATLGEKLYHDPRLSGDDTVSCASCDDLAKGGTDQLPLSRGIGGRLGGITSPTPFNSGFNFVQFWDGRARPLEEQAAGPIHNPSEMGSSWPEVIAKLGADPFFRQFFAASYPDGITAVNITDAIGTFEKSLITPNSPFDRYLRGENEAIGPAAREGYRLFKEFGCVACHQGVNIGGNMFQTVGVLENYFAHRPITKADRGRYNVTGRAWNMHQFKVPTLRNIALTFPYLHDGSVATLRGVLEGMCSSQLG